MELDDDVVSQIVEGKLRIVGLHFERPHHDRQRAAEVREVGIRALHPAHLPKKGTARLAW